MHAVDSYNRSPSACAPQNTSVAEEAINLWCVVSSQNRVLAQMSYRSSGEVLITFLCWTNEINSIVPAPAEERVVATDDGNCNIAHVIRPDRKDVV